MFTLRVMRSFPIDVWKSNLCVPPKCHWLAIPLATFRSSSARVRARPAARAHMRARAPPEWLVVPQRRVAPGAALRGEARGGDAPRGPGGRHGGDGRRAAWGVARVGGAPAEARGPNTGGIGRDPRLQRRLFRRSAGAAEGNICAWSAWFWRQLADGIAPCGERAHRRGLEESLKSARSRTPRAFAQLENGEYAQATRPLDRAASPRRHGAQELNAEAKKAHRH